MLKHFKKDFMASIVVFLVAIPLCMGIAVASNVPIQYGILSGIIGGLIVGSITGSPLQVSGPAAGLVVLVLNIVDQYGLIGLGTALIHYHLTFSCSHSHVLHCNSGNSALH